MEQNLSSQMVRLCSQWLLEIRFPCRDSENSSDSGSKRNRFNDFQVYECILYTFFQVWTRWCLRGLAFVAPSRV